MERIGNRPEALLAQPELMSVSAEDWTELQGGCPEVWVNDSPTCLVIHNYEGRRREYPPAYGAIVDTEIERLKNTAIRRLPDGKLIWVPSALIWDLHGAPCEQASRAAGFKSGYDRVTVGDTRYWQKLRANGYVKLFPLDRPTDAS